MTDINEAKRLILADWEKKRDDLDVLISALRRELGMSADSAQSDSVVLHPAASSTSTAPIRVEDVVTPGDFFGASQVSAAKEFLTRLNKRTATLNEIGAALYRGKCTTSPLDEKRLKNLSSLLSRSDEFTSVAKSRWGLSEWYPNRQSKSRKANGETQPQTKTVSEETLPEMEIMK